MARPSSKPLTKQTHAKALRDAGNYARDKAIEVVTEQQKPFAQHQERYKLCQTIIDGINAQRPAAVKASSSASKKSSKATPVKASLSKVGGVGGW